MKKTTSFYRMLRRTALCLAAGAALAACSSVAITGRKQLLLVSDSEVLSLSQQNYSEYMRTAKKSTDAAQTQLVRTVGQRIASAVETYLRQNGQASEIQNYAWEFNLVQDATPNAFCMPGGKIVVYEGILPYTRDANGLAIVLGHEVAHAVARHSAEQISRQLLLNYGGQALSSVMASKSATSQVLAQQVFGLGAKYGVTLPYSRQNESEADRIGLIFAAMAGYDPQAAIPFWQRMSAGTSGSTPEFMSTHPSDETRIENLRELMPEALRYYKGGSQPVTTPASGGTTRIVGGVPTSGTRVFTPEELNGGR
ncbi:MAG: M48 family metallopeptidase [Bacteroidaceae bacterium]|jgi:predicted Zn-dependent protease